MIDIILACSFTFLAGVLIVAWLDRQLDVRQIAEEEYRELCRK